MEQRVAPGGTQRELPADDDREGSRHRPYFDVRRLGGLRSVRPSHCDPRFPAATSLLENDGEQTDRGELRRLSRARRSVSLAEGRAFRSPAPRSRARSGRRIHRPHLARGGGESGCRSRPRDSTSRWIEPARRPQRRSPYSDYTGYQPANGPIDLRDPNRWRPLPTATGAQVFLTPHWGHVTPLALPPLHAQSAIRSFRHVLAGFLGHRARHHAAEEGHAPLSDLRRRRGRGGVTRRLGGIHFRQGDLESREMGRRVAKQVWAKARYLCGR